MLTTQRMLLLPATAEWWQAGSHDLNQLAELIDADVPADWPPMYATEADLRTFRRHYKTLGEETPWLAWFAVLREPTPTLVASLGFKGAPDSVGAVEIGYALVPAYRGCGLATEMVDALSSWALSQPHVVRVVADVKPDNVASVRVLTEVGFQLAGTINHDHRYVLAVTEVGR